MKWTDPMHLQLIALVNDGLSAKQIARKISMTHKVVVSKNSIIGRVHRTKGLKLSNTCLRPVETRAKPRARAQATARLTHGEATNRRFCGHETEPGSSWCGLHASICLTKARAA
jgi:hypothetical protein